MLSIKLKSEIAQVVKANPGANAQNAVNQYLSQALQPICEKFAVAVDKLNALDGYDAQDYVDETTPLTIALEMLAQNSTDAEIVITQVINDLEDDAAVLEHYIMERQDHDLTDTADIAIRTLEAQQDLVNHVRNICDAAMQLVEEQNTIVPVFAAY